MTSSQIKKGTRHFIAGQTYYVEALGRRNPNWIQVFKGTFQELRPSGAVVFSGKEAVANMRQDDLLGNPILDGYVYYKALPTSPTSKDRSRKAAVIQEMDEFHFVQKAEPIDQTPTISFMGEDYRKKRDSFYRTRKSKSRSMSKSQKSMSKSQKSRSKSRSMSKSQKSRSMSKSQNGSRSRSKN